MGDFVKALALLIAPLLALGACGGPDPLQTHVEQPRYRAALIVPNDNDYYRTIQAGAVETAQSTGMQLDITNDASTAGAQQRAIQRAVQNGDAGILIAPVGPAVDPFLQNARSKGVKVIQLGGGVAQESTQADFTVKVDDCVLGLSLGQWMGNRMPESSVWWPEQKKTVLVRVTGPTGQLPTATCRDDAFLQGMGIDPSAINPATGTGSGTYGPYAVPWEVVCTITDDGDLAKVQEAVRQCILNHPDVNGIYTSDGALAQAAGDGARYAGKTIGVDVVLVTTGATEQSLDLAKGTWVAADARPRVRAIGGFAVGALNDYLAGKTPTTQGGKAFNDTGVDLCTDDPRQAVLNAVTLSIPECLDRLSEIPARP